jgi:flavonoid 6-hydroxylase
MSFTPYGDYWRKLRKICTLELLSSKRVQSFQPVRIEELTNLIKFIASKEGTPMNLTKQMLSTISTITARVAFGKKCKENQKFISVARERFVPCVTLRLSFNCCTDLVGVDFLGKFVLMDI